MLPLVRVIASDLASLWCNLVERRERLSAIKARRAGEASDLYSDEVRDVETVIENESKRLQGYVAEINELGLELGAIDGSIAFPSMIGDCPAYLLWTLGDPEVKYWVKSLKDCEDPLLLGELSVGT